MVIIKYYFQGIEKIFIHIKYNKKAKKILIKLNYQFKNKLNINKIIQLNHKMNKFKKFNNKVKIQMMIRKCQMENKKGKFIQKIKIFHKNKENLLINFNSIKLLIKMMKSYLKKSIQNT